MAFGDDAGLVGGRRRRHRKTARKQRGGVNIIGKALNFVTGNTSAAVPAAPAAPASPAAALKGGSPRARGRSLKRSRTRTFAFAGGRKRSSRKRSHKRRSHKRMAGGIFAM
jgi:hypothetical protein